MPKKLRIAVPIDLDWPIKRHYDAYSGIQEYAEKVGNWELVMDQFPAAWLAGEGDRAGYDGVVGRVTAEVLTFCRQSGTPVINIWGNSPIQGQVHSVLADYKAAGRLAAKHLVARGLRRLAGVGYRDRGPYGTRAYFKGMQEVAKENGIPWSSHFVSFTYNDNESSWHEFFNDAEDWFDQWGSLIGVAAAQDVHARHIALMGQRRGLSIPGQLAIVGGGNELLTCEGASPSLSSVDFGVRHVGYRAAEYLDQLLQGQAIEHEVSVPIMLPTPELVARRSTDSYLVHDESVGKAMRYMTEKAGTKISVPDVINHVGCSRRTLENLFRNTLGHSINDQLVTLRLEIVKRLLAKTKNTVKVIAKEAGFGSPEHMRFSFKQHMHMTPGEYRRENR